MINIAVFVSGSGSNLQCIIDAIADKKINANLALVVASKHNIFALERAKQAHIPTAIFDKKDFGNTQEMYDIMLGTLDFYGIDFIVLAGYLSILPKTMVDSFPNRIINIHPSLIPKYCGKNFYGMAVHQAVIDNKEKQSGATVHYVDEGTDTGQIILQKQINVDSLDTPQSLQQKVLQIEHQILPKAINIALMRLSKEEK